VKVHCIGYCSYEALDYARVPLDMLKCKAVPKGKKAPSVPAALDNMRNINFRQQEPLQNPLKVQSLNNVLFNPFSGHEAVELDFSFQSPASGQCVCV